MDEPPRICFSPSNCLGSQNLEQRQGRRVKRLVRIVNPRFDRGLRYINYWNAWFRCVQRSMFDGFNQYPFRPHQVPGHQVSLLRTLLPLSQLSASVGRFIIGRTTPAPSVIAFGLDRSLSIMALDASRSTVLSSDFPTPGWGQGLSTGATNSEWKTAMETVNYTAGALRKSSDNYQSIGNLFHKMIMMHWLL